MIKLFSSLPLSSLLQPVEWYHYIASLINPAHQLPDLKVGEMYAEVAEYTQAGNFWDFIWGNVTLGQKATFRYDRKESPFLDKDTDNLRNLFCSSLCPERVDYAEQYNHTANSRNCVRYVAKVSFYFRTGSFIRIALPT